MKWLLLTALMLLSACSQPAKPSLYQQLGGETGISAITDALLNEIANDDRIVHHFVDTDIERFRDLLAQHLCQLSNGPCSYAGGTMQDTHTGFNISLADFDALVGHLINVMQRQNISVSAQNQLLSILAPMYKDISYR